MRRLVLIAGLGLVASAASAQTPDSIAWRRYFPLAVGNAWEYLNEYDEGMGPNFGRPFFFTERYSVVARHVRSVDTLYALAVHVTEATARRPESRDTVWVRYDAARRAIVDADVALTRVWLLRFSNDLGLSQRAVSAFPFPSHFAARDVSRISGIGSRWVSDVGMLSGWSGQDGCPLCEFSRWRLVRATVDGRTYEVGEMSVGAERADVARGVTLHPSVTRTAVTLHLPLAATVEAFDVTGRRVLHLAADVGDVRLDVSAWAPGLYVVRAGRDTRRLVVAR